MTGFLEITVHCDQPFTCEADLARQMGQKISMVRAMGRDGRLPRPIIRNRTGNGNGYVWRTIDLHTHQTPVSTLKVEVANDTIQTLNPETGKVSGAWAIEQAKQRRATKAANR